MWMVWVEYSGNLYFQDSNMDSTIAQKLRKHISGTGFCFGNGRRDVSFDFRKKSDAERAVKTARKIRGVKKVYITEF
jgi:hypothetical protein